MKLRRICGDRYPGLVYIEEADVSNYPMDAFMLDPTIPIDLAGLGIAPIGMYVLPRPGQPNIYDLWDVVGWPYTPSDFMTEASYYGTSRKTSEVFLRGDFKLLTVDSYHNYLSRGACVDPEQLEWINTNALFIKSCPMNDNDHRLPNFPHTCIATLWECVEPMKKKHKNRQFTRLVPEEQPAFAYLAGRVPFELKSSYGLFMRVPAVHMQLAVIEDPVEGLHEEALKMLEELDTPFFYYLSTQEDEPDVSQEALDGS